MVHGQTALETHFALHPFMLRCHPLEHHLVFITAQQHIIVGRGEMGGKTNHAFAVGSQPNHDDTFAKRSYHFPAEINPTRLVRGDNHGAVEREVTFIVRILRMAWK